MGGFLSHEGGGDVRAGLTFVTKKVVIFFEGFPKSFKRDLILANGSLSSYFTVFTVKNKSASFPCTLSILYFRLIMHFLQSDQSESSIKGALQLVKS